MIVHEVIDDLERGDKVETRETVNFHLLQGAITHFNLFRKLIKKFLT